MHTPAQEALAQVMFWGSIAGLPISIVIFVFVFRIRSSMTRICVSAIAGALLTQFLWYWVYMGIALSDKVGGALYPIWWQFAPVGFGIALLVLMVSGIFWVWHSSDLTRR